MCEFKIIVYELGKKEYVATEDVSFIKLQESDGTILLKGLGVQEKVETAIIREVNVYAEDGATAKLFKAPIIGKFVKFLKTLEAGAYNSELEKSWTEFVGEGNKMLEEMKKK